MSGAVAAIAVAMALPISGCWPSAGGDEASWRPRGRRRYLLVGGAAAALAAALGTSEIIVVASRALAAYYALKCAVALRTGNRGWIRVGYGILALLMTIEALASAPEMFHPSASRATTRSVAVARPPT